MREDLFVLRATKFELKRSSKGAIHIRICIIFFSGIRHPNEDPDQSPRSQLRKTGKVSQISMFRTNKKLLYLFEFEQNELKLFFKIFLKNHLHIFWLNSLGSVNVFSYKHACLRNFPEMRGLRTPGQFIKNRKTRGNNLLRHPWTNQKNQNIIAFRTFSWIFSLWHKNQFQFTKS